jgi:hypothetical protein
MFGAGIFESVMGLMRTVDGLEESFRTGVGEPYDSFGKQTAVGIERTFRPFFRSRLMPEVLPALPIREMSCVLARSPVYPDSQRPVTGSVNSKTGIPPPEDPDPDHDRQFLPRLPAYGKHTAQSYVSRPIAQLVLGILGAGESRQHAPEIQGQRDRGQWTP